jgi:hypothetical protein
MTRLLICSAVALALVTTAAPARADVKTREKGAVKFEGMLGRMVGMFGGRAASEGVVSTTVVKGTRKATTTDTTARIVDLSEEKIYDIDMKKKTYEVTTFDELRRRMREASERAERNARKEEGRQEQSAKPEKEVEVDFDVKETGQKKSIAGYDAKQVIMTIAVREKGRTLEEGGGLVLTADSWIAPHIAAMKEITDFEMRYWKQLQGPDAAAVSAEQMAAVMAMYPMLKDAMDRQRKELSVLDGTPLATTTTFEAVKTKAQLEEEKSSAGGSGGGGLGGMLARRVMKKEEPKARATIMTLQHELQEVSTAVAPAELALPAGFKEKK